MISLSDSIVKQKISEIFTLINKILIDVKTIMNYAL